MEGGYGRDSYRGRGGGGGSGGRGRGGGGNGGRGRGRGRGAAGGGDHQHRQADQHWRVSGQGGTQELGSGRTKMEVGEGSNSMRGGYGSRGGGGGAWRGSGRGWGGAANFESHKSSSEAAPDPVVPDIQQLKISEQMPPSSPENPGRLVPVRRTDNGGTSSIRTVRLLVNHFPVKFNPECIIMHYDIDIKQEVAAKNGRPAKITKSDMRAIRNKLFSDNPTKFPMSNTAYDGMKNVFSAVPLPTGKFKVDFSEGEDVKLRSYIVTIKLVNELKLGKLNDYLNGNSFSIPRDILQGMDLVVKENPTRRMITFGRSFYPAEFSRKDDLGSGIIASKGFQHSLKLTSQGLALCLDSSVLAFRKPIPVIDFLMEHLREFKMNDFSRRRREVEFALKGLKVMVTHRNTKQKYPIARLTDKDTRRISFILRDPEGRAPDEEVGLINYFREKYGKDIMYKDIPCLDLGKNNRQNYVPMEFCVLVEGQRYPKEHLENNVALRNEAKRLKDVSLPQPKERMERICGMVESENGPCGGGITQNFGIKVDREMTRVGGRVLKPPELKIGDSSGKLHHLTVDKDKCQWNLVGKSFVEGKPILRWAVIDFSASDRYCRLDPNHFIPKLIKRCRSLGIHMEEPFLYEPSRMDMFSSVTKLFELLETIKEKCEEECKGQLQLFLCVMAKKDPGYKYLKWVSETRIGVVTQCCLSKPANEAKDQYLANLALKINAKLGGSNVELYTQLPRFEGEGQVMFVGADVNHPAAGNIISPSVAAVVATVNWPAANRYVARIRLQEHRKEEISNFGEMCLELVEQYVQFNGVRPESIVVFRDGVSESQIDMALNVELIDLRRAFQSRNYLPKITVIVAQKRHQTRLFPETPRDGGSTGNVPPGTVVDTKIVSPLDYDFYLCSHYGLIGTSKPTHYQVIWDEHRLTSDQVQQLIYYLCFTFARCTKPVSLIPPVYYADLAAYRGRLYHEAVVESGTSSNERSYKLHGKLENDFFFI